VNTLGLDKRLGELARKAGALRPHKLRPLPVTLEAVKVAIASADPRALSDIFEQSEWETYLKCLDLPDLETLCTLLDAKERATFSLAVTAPAPTTQPALDVQPAGRVDVAQALPKRDPGASCEPISGEAALVNAVEKISEEPAGAEEVEVIVLRRNPGDPPVMPPGSRVYGSAADWDPYERYQQ
jgi:hypothetical protein